MRYGKSRLKAAKQAEPITDQNLRSKYIQESAYTVNS